MMWNYSVLIGELDECIYFIIEKFAFEFVFSFGTFMPQG